MSSVYRFLYNLVGFSRSQANGFLVLLPLLCLGLFSEPIFRSIQKEERVAQRDILKLDSLIALWPTSNHSANKEEEEFSPFNFDPNKISVDEFQKLGFSRQLAARIINYRSKGGAFRTKADLLKIHGLDSALYNLIEDYIQLPKNLNHATRKSAGPFVQQKFDLNTADTMQLKSIQGIGTKLSLRIWKYREALGGFVSSKQVYEVYKLDSLVADRLIGRSFISSQFIPRRLNLNTADRQEFAVHPYLTRQVADAIVSYRFLHGNYKAIEDLRNLPVIDSVTLRKIKPYLFVGNN